MSIDLHLHSCFSDGTHTPGELIELARARGLSAISVTDHDSVEGVAELIAAGKEADVEAVAGIELSVVFGDNHLHLLGYFFDHTDRDFREKIAVLQDARNIRNKKIIGKLQKLGIKIDEDEVAQISSTGQTGRPHIAQVLMAKGVVRSMDEAFERYLKKDARAYVSRFVYKGTEAIDIIKMCGGLAILAHPAQLVSGYQELQLLVGRLVDCGLDGLEVYYPGYSAKTRKNLKKIAKRYDMVISGGSDFHGDVRPHTDLAGGNNVYVPTEILEEMRHRLNS
ncbi:MAG: PHP domain-containing protein [Desulfocapsaceae bacterium]|nr:PHP domain-containing protein [Desulfocapsaceae bacterium]